MLVFDKWTCHTNERQAIFFRSGGESRYQAQTSGILLQRRRMEFSGCATARTVFAAPPIRLRPGRRVVRTLAGARERENDRQFIAKLLAEQDTSIVPLNRVEKFVEELRVRLRSSVDAQESRRAERSGRNFSNPCTSLARNRSPHWQRACAK